MPACPTPASTARLTSHSCTAANSRPPRLDLGLWLRRQPSTADLLAGLRFAASSPALWRLAAVYALKSFAAYALIFWTPLAISDLLGGHAAAGGGPTAAVLLTAVPYTFAAVTAVAVGWSSHARNERRMHTAAPFTIGAGILLCAPLLQVRCGLRAGWTRTGVPCAAAAACV